MQRYISKRGLENEGSIVLPWEARSWRSGLPGIGRNQIKAARDARVTR
jgi:hypothetical protein